MKVCNECGKENNQDSKFCNSCGRKFDNHIIESNPKINNNKKSKILLVSAILSTLYVLYLIIDFSSLTKDISGFTDAIVSALVIAFFVPHIIIMALGTIFSWLGFFLEKAWCALVSAILSCVGALMVPMLAKFCIPLIILGFIGYAKQKNLLRIKIK